VGRTQKEKQKKGVSVKRKEDEKNRSKMVPSRWTFKEVQLFNSSTRRKGEQSIQRKEE